jgi:hypothetical protein
MRLVAQCSNCRAKFEGSFHGKREIESARAMAARFKENHVEGSPDHEVVITETPPRTDET